MPLAAPSVTLNDAGAELAFPSTTVASLTESVVERIVVDDRRRALVVRSQDRCLERAGEIDEEGLVGLVERVRDERD